MPTYSYSCSTCGPFAAIRRMAEFDQPHPCPVCGEVSPRTLTVPALLGSRAAADAETRAKSSGAAGTAGSGYGRMRHMGGCSCC